MGPLVVVLLTKSVEGALLGRKIRPRRPNGTPFQGLVHALVGAVLLRVRGQDALVLNPQAQPPDVERGESVQRRGGERDAVVGANGPWQARR